MGSHDTTAALDVAAEHGLLRHRAWLLFALVVVATLLRLPLLDRPIWFDEACMSDQRIGTTPQLLATLYTDIHPPLFVSFMHLWNRMFGDGEIMLRLPALISGLLSIPLTYWVGSRLLGHGPALMAALLLTLSPVHVWYSTEARLYAPMVLLTLFAFGCLDRLTDSQQAPRKALFYAHLLNVAVMLSLHYYLAVIVVAVAGLAPILMRGVTGRARSLLLWHGVGILGLAGFVVVKMKLGEFETSQTYLRALTFDELFRFLFDWSWTGNTMQTSDSGLSRGLGVGFAWLGVGLAALGLIRIAGNLRSKPRGWLVPVGIVLLPGFLLACVALGYDNTYLERTLIPALPFVFLLAAAGLQMLRGKLRMIANSVTAALALTALIHLYGSFDSRWTVYKPHPDWRSAAQYLGGEIDDGMGGTPVFTSMPNPRSLSYYDVRIQDAKNLKVELSPEKIGNKVGKRVGSWLGALAETTFAEFAAHNQSLADGADLTVYRCKPSPDELEMTCHCSATTCYLVRNEWHPHVSVDDSVEALLAHPSTDILHTERCRGVTIYKVRFQQ